MLATATLETLQSRVGSALRDRVAGPDAEERAARIWGTPGERWFTPQDPVWRVHAHASMFPGGVAALLLQMLHPMAMAGVAGHSGYRGDPWGRLQRTSHYLSTTTFGTIEHALEAVGKVRAIHERVRGKDALGRPYRASDPHLLMWVHIAEIASFLRAYQAYSGTPLTPDEADTYVAQAGVAAQHLGVIEPPRTTARLNELLREYRGELQVTDAARDAAAFLLREPPLPSAAQPGYWAIAAGGVGLLAPWARDQLGLPATRAVDRALLWPAGWASTRVVAWAMAAAREERTLAPQVEPALQS